MWTKSMTKSDIQISRRRGGMRSFCAKMRSAKTLTGCSSSAHCRESLWIVQGHVVLHYKKGGYF